MSTYTQSKYSQETTCNVLKLWDSGLAVKEVAAVLGCSVTTVYAILHQNDRDLGLRNQHPFCGKEIVIGHLDPAWASEFRGFFLADGCAMMVCVRKNRGKPCPLRHYPVLTICLRADDAPLLQDIKEKLGGRLVPWERSKRINGEKVYDCKPRLQWVAQGWSLCRAILEAVLLEGVLPAKKRRDLDLIYRAILARHSMSHQLTDSEREELGKFHQALQEVKRYSAVKVPVA